MNERERARSGPAPGWDRARRAYVGLLGADDPAASFLADGALDLRLGHDAASLDPARRLVVSGPDDLVELRTIVESAIGVGSWPAPARADGEPVVAVVGSPRPAAMLGLLMAMDGLIETRSPWGRWRTVVDTMAARVAAIDTITVDLRVVEPRM